MIEDVNVLGLRTLTSSKSQVWKNFFFSEKKFFFHFFFCYYIHGCKYISSFVPLSICIILFFCCFPTEWRNKNKYKNAIFYILNFPKIFDLPAKNSVTYSHRIEKKTFCKGDGIPINKKIMNFFFFILKKIFFWHPRFRGR